MLLISLVLSIRNCSQKHKNLLYVFLPDRDSVPLISVLCSINVLTDVILCIVKTNFLHFINLSSNLLSLRYDIVTKCRRVVILS